MTAHTPLEQAIAAWLRVKDPDNQQPQVDDAISLGETGVFSNRHIAAMTGLNPDLVGALTKKTDKTGGRFNPEALLLMRQLRIQHARGVRVAREDVRVVVGLGVSPGMLAKLTGISRTAIYSWTGGVTVEKTDRA